MKKRFKRRTATTLIELVVVLVMMSLFIYIVFNVFNVTYDAYQFNREFAAKMYAQTNMDNFFEVFESELMFAGSMDQIIQDLPGMTIEGNKSLYIENNSTNTNGGNSTRITNATVTTRYALAEKIILTKGSIDAYGQLTYNGGATLTSKESSRTYFALFSAEFPATETNEQSFWSLGYKNMNTTPSATLLEITDFSTDLYTRTTDNKEFVGVRIEEALALDESTLTGTELKTFISPLLYEKSIESLSRPFEIDGKEWDGEIIYRSRIYSTFINDDNPDRQTIKIDKYIPTADATYTLKLIDDVISFDATELTDDDIFVATVSYYVDLPGFDNESSITVSRKFLKNF